MLECEFKEITRKTIEKVPVRRTCDICGKEIDQSNWFRMTVCHNDWGGMIASIVLACSTFAALLALLFTLHTI